MTDKPWLKQPGECYDSRGIPIHPGDLLRTPHFRGPRRKMYHFYHVAVFDQDAGGMRMVPAAWADDSYVRQGGNPMLSDSLARDATIVDGPIVGDAILFDERPRRKL